MATMFLPHRWKYDVFISFRGEDIRKSFMDHLFNDFKQKGIHAFRDDRELPKGEEISLHLYKAIEESRFLIVIFSKNYASSSWCLRELVKILDCKRIKNPKHEVRIIFYDTKPDVVRKQKRSYAEAFCKHEVSNCEEVGKWKEALSIAANLSGWDLEDMTNGYEYKFIDCISKDILNKLGDGPLHVGENLVGIDLHFVKLNLSRYVGSHKINMLGICGISGTGKTTLAKAIYNLMFAHFEGSCFCEDVKQVTNRQGLIQVQMNLINKIMKTDDLKISSPGEGSMLIKQRIGCKPILLVLDDVNNMEQLEALADSPDWFFPGSLIIFTSKDKQLLRSHRVDDIYEMGNLDKCKALELFCLYAFGKRHPTEEIEEFASQVVKYLQGHPLALKVIGRSLYGKSMHVWKSELDRLQTYPNSEIVQKLRPSFDCLASDEKIMFLDIACAFIGENKDFAASVLDNSHCHCSANAIIEVLADKFLITVSAYDMHLQMHELIQSMAREIIREEFRQNHRRLWISSEDYDMLNVNKVTEEIEVLVLLLKNNCQNIPIDGQALTRMTNLRILKICLPEFEGRGNPIVGNISGRLDLLSNKLRLLSWHGCPCKYLPSNFYPKNIVAIDLSYSHIKQLWTTSKCLRRLKVMKLRYCCNLTTTPDFSEITNLEVLSLEGCVNMVTVHPSIGMLKRLVVLNMRDCKRAKSFPSKVEMESLQVLNLSGCLIINELPEAFLSRWWTSIPGFIWNQQHPQRSVSLAGLHLLTSLNFSYCNLLEVRESIGGLSCLVRLYLKGNNFTSLPRSLSLLSHLRHLYLNGCKKLEVLPEIPPSVWNIHAYECTSLREVSGSSKDPLKNRHRNNNFRDCPNLFKNVSIDNEGSISKTQCLGSSITSQGFIHPLSAFLEYLGVHANSFLQDIGGTLGISVLDILYYGNSMPEWFTNRSTENHVNVELPSDWCFNKLKGYGTCVVFKCKNPLSRFKGYSVKNFDGASMTSKDKFPQVIYNHIKKSLKEEVIWLHYRRDTDGWEEANNFVTFGFKENNEDVEVKEFGARVICDEDIHQDIPNFYSKTSIVRNMFQDLPTQSQHGGGMSFSGPYGYSRWSW